MLDGYHFALTSYGGNGGTYSYLPQQATADGVFHTTGEASDPTANQRPVRLKNIIDGASARMVKQPKRARGTMEIGNYDGLRHVMSAEAAGRQ